MQKDWINSKVCYITTGYSFQLLSNCEYIGKQRTVTLSTRKVKYITTSQNSSFNSLTLSTDSPTLTLFKNYEHLRLPNIVIHKHFHIKVCMLMFWKKYNVRFYGG